MANDSTSAAQPVPGTHRFGLRDDRWSRGCGVGRPVQGQGPSHIVWCPSAPGAIAVRRIPRPAPRGPVGRRRRGERGGQRPLLYRSAEAVATQVAHGRPGARDYVSTGQGQSAKGLSVRTQNWRRRMHGRRPGRVTVPAGRRTAGACCHYCDGQRRDHRRWTNSLHGIHPRYGTHPPRSRLHRRPWRRPSAAKHPLCRDQDPVTCTPVANRTSSSAVSLTVA